MRHGSANCILVVSLVTLVPSGLLAQSPFLHVVGPNFTTVGNPVTVTLTGFDLAGTVGLPQVCYTPSGSMTPCPVALTGVTVSSSNLLGATLPAPASASSGSIAVRPNFGGIQIFSNSLQFYVQNSGDLPAPVLSQLAPAEVLADSPTLDLTLTGSGFSPPLDVGTAAYLVLPGSNPVALSTTVQSGSQLLAAVPADLLVSAADYRLFVTVGSRTTALLRFRVVELIFGDGFETGLTRWTLPPP